MQHVVGQRKQVLEKREEDLGDHSQTAYGNLFLFKWKTNEFLPGDDREFLFRIFLYFCGAVFWFKDERKIKFQARIIQDETIALFTSGPHWFNLQLCKQNWDWMSLKLIQTCICMRSSAPTTPLTSFSIWICLQVWKHLSLLTLFAVCAPPLVHGQLGVWIIQGVPPLLFAPCDLHLRTTNAFRLLQRCQRALEGLTLFFHSIH